MEALLVVDVQKDFCPGGALAVTGGDEVVPVINRAAEYLSHMGWLVGATMDTHPPQTSHFDKWPVHCVRGTDGWHFHPDLKLPKAEIFYKGEEGDGYSGFEGKTAKGLPLNTWLETNRIERLHVCGLTTDYCVKETVLDALRKGFEVHVLVDAVRAVDEEDGKRALELMKHGGAILTTTEELLETYGADLKRC
jgi:nicotinamidase/pyrazinamidase